MFNDLTTTFLDQNKAYLPDPFVGEVNLPNIVVLFRIPLQINITPLLLEPAFYGDELIFFIHVQDLCYQKWEGDIDGVFVGVNWPNELKPEIQINNQRERGSEAGMETRPRKNIPEESVSFSQLA